MKNWLRFIKYGLVAAGSAAVDWLFFITLTYFSLSPLYAQMSARLSGGIFSFTTNKLWSFKARGGSVWVEGMHFGVLYVFSYALSISCFWGFVKVVGLGPYSAKWISDIVCFCFNFVVMRTFVFAERSKRESTTPASRSVDTNASLEKNLYSTSR